MAKNKDEKDSLLEKGIKITLKNGIVDHYSPCDEIRIDNGFYQYRIKVDDIKKIETYKIDEPF